MDRGNLQELFELKCFLRNLEIKLAARVENGVKQLIALVLSDGDIVLHYSFGELPPVIRRIPWFTGKTKEIQAICFDNTATWLLTVSLDGSLYIIPALSLVDKRQKVDCKWSLNDITHFPKHAQTPESKPICILWWQTLDCNQNALVGYENGALGLISLTDGRCIGVCNITEEIVKLCLCQDNTLDCVYLMINGKSGHQWRLILEQHSTGYVWPPEANINASDSMTSKLQSLKQMGVDKLASLKQRLSDTRGPRRDSQTSDSASESSHSEHSHTGPELLPHLCDTFFAPQYARNRYLFSAFYKPTSLLTIHGIDIESAPLYVHRLPPSVGYLLVTDRFIYCISEDLKTLFVVSTQLSECHLEGDAEFNTESLVAQFTFENQDEHILNIFKLTDIMLIHDRKQKEEKRKEKDKTYTLPSSINDINIARPKVDMCVVISNRAIYKVFIRCSPVKTFVNLVVEENDLEKAEKLALVFSLNLQQLLENCGDILISNGSFHQGLILYKQAKTHLLKRVLKLAICGDSQALLKFVHLCLSVSKVDMSTPTKIHMGNLAVMAFIEQILRYGGDERIENTNNFMSFLKHEEFYDQVLAVNVACQAGQWNVVSLLAQSRGLQPEVVTALSQILTSASVHHEFTYDFLLTLSEPCLTQSLLIFPSAGQIILNYIRTNVESFPVEVLQRLVLQLDPSQPCTLPLVSLSTVKQKNSTSLDSMIDSLEIEHFDKGITIIKEFIETFICVLIHLVAKMDDSGYSIDLLEKIDPPEPPVEEPYITKMPKAHPLGCGYEHAAVVRNGFVYSMGVASSGCLGFGPLLIQSSPPRIVQTLADLKVKAISISCGRKHTLVLTDFGVYCWGSNALGQLGLGQQVQESPYPQIISSLSSVKIVDVVAGQYHSTALTAQGKVYTWGWGIHGQLGHGTCDNQYVPKLLHIPHTIVQISAGHAHTLLLSADGKLYGFGSNAFGQLECNNLKKTKTSTPVLIFLQPDIHMPLEKINTAYFHNIAVRVDQKVYTWGASPQEVRLSQSKFSQKMTEARTKLYEPWKTTVHVYSGSTHKPIEEIAVGFRHTAVLHNGKILLGKNMDEELTSPKLNEKESMGILSQRFIHIGCGSDYTMAMDHSGKVLAWGSYSMAQTLIGKPMDEDSKRVDGKVVVFKNTRRIIKLPHGFQNSCESSPVEVPGLPSLAITFNPPDHQTILSKKIPVSIHSIENKVQSKEMLVSTSTDNYSFKYGPKTLHFVLETYYGFYDIESTLAKCLQVKNYQAASKLALLDGHYSDSLSFQLMAFRDYCKKFNLDFEPTLQNEFFSSNQFMGKDKTCESVMDTNKQNDMNDLNVQANEKITNSPARILSSSSSLDSLKQWTDDVENQGGRESPCSISEFGEMRQTMAHFLHSMKSENSPPISSISKLVLHNKIPEGELKKDDEVYAQIKDENTKEIVKQAFHLIEFYIQKIYSSENHILMQNILLKSIEFWLSNNLPVPVLENILLKNMDKYFYPLSILLFCKNFNNNLGEEIVKKDADEKEKTSANFLKEFSTKFCLQLCYMVLENVNKS